MPGAAPPPGGGGAVGGWLVHDLATLLSAVGRGLDRSAADQPEQAADHPLANLLGRPRGVVVLFAACVQERGSEFGPAVADLVAVSGGGEKTCVA